MTVTDIEEKTSISRMVSEMGPMIKSDSPFEGRSSKAAAKHKGVEILSPSSSVACTENSFRKGSVSNHDEIVYHRKDNDPRKVVQMWLDENPHILEESSSWAVYTALKRRHSNEELHDALMPVLKERDPEGWKFDVESSEK